MTSRPYHADSGRTTAAVLEPPSTFESISLPQLIDMLDDVQSAIAKAKNDESFLIAYITRRMIADDALVVHHPAYEHFGLKQPRKRVVNDPLLYDVMQGLVKDGLVPAKLASKASWKVEIPASVEYKHHLTHIATIEKCGKSVRARIAKAIDNRIEPLRLDFERKA